MAAHDVLFAYNQCIHTCQQFSSPVVRQTIILGFAIICILYIFSSLINMQEVRAWARACAVACPS